QFLAASNANARCTFTSYGGALKLVELEGIHQTISCRGKRPPGAERLASLNALAPQPVLNLLSPALQGDGVFKLSPFDNGVRAEKAFTNGLSVVKEFRLSSNYLIEATVRLENHSGQTIDLPPQEWSLGTATP